MHRVRRLRRSETRSVSQNSSQDLLLVEASETHRGSQRSHDTRWPALPTFLKESSPSTAIGLLPSFLLLLVPLGFYVLGISILRLNGKFEKSDHDIGNTVIQATKTASTLWPILFAAVVGAMLKATTLYLAERGTDLGTLEVLTTSQTLVSTVRGCFSHRILGVWTVVLIVIWSLSPAGGQAVLRSVSFEVDKLSRDYRLRYYPSNNLLSNMNESPFVGASGASWAIGKLHRIADAAISSPDVTVLFSKGASPGFDAAVERLGGEEHAAQVAQTDLWGNVRIPFLHMLPGYNDNDRSKWIEVPLTNIAPYSSLIGHTIRGIPLSSVGNISLSLQTVYHTTSCKPWLNGTEWLQHNPGRLTLHKRTNYSIFTENPLSGGNANIFLDTLIPKNFTQPIPYDMPSNRVDKAILVLGARPTSPLPGAGPFYDIEMTHCEVTATYVETEVKCIRLSAGSVSSCAASRMRETPGKPPSNWSSLNWAGSWVAQYLLYVPDTVQSTHPSGPSGLELYLQDPPTAFSGGSEFYGYHNVTLDIFQARLALILNTFYHASLNTSNFLGADGVALYEVESYYELQYGNATGTWTKFTPRKYVVQYAWLSLYLASTTILAICAAVTVIFSALTRAPDLFCGVSSLTRDSALMTRVPEGGSALSGSERARLLRGLWVRIQDVRPEDDVGRIAFSDQKELGAAAALRWDRKYK